MSPAIRSRGFLPHWESEHPVYFVTFRLADSLPQGLLARLRAERAAIERSKQIGERVAPDGFRLRQLRALLQKAERFLDKGMGRCYMRDARVAAIVAGAIRRFHGQRYRLIAWCVMPNHVHVVFSPLGEYNLANIVHSWKSFSAHAANRIVGRTGTFWQREYFDHLVRSEASLLKIARYVAENPQRAGLRPWPWVGIIS